MTSYIIRRLLLFLPTLLGILVVCFVVIQFAPGGPIDNYIAQNFRNHDSDGSIGQATSKQPMKTSVGSQGVSPEVIEKLKKLYGFDKPPLERFWIMVKNYSTFNFGNSYVRDDMKVSDIILSKLPVSISLGLWLALMTYSISIPMGIKKAVQKGSKFDNISSIFIIFGYTIPSFLIAIFLIILFAGGSFFNILPLGGLVSENFYKLPWYSKIIDYFSHLIMPLTALGASTFAFNTLLTKNSFLEELGKTYVMVAKSKGLKEKSVLYGHIFRNGMLVVVSSLPVAFFHVFITGSFLIEYMFSLDGIGLLSYHSLITRDYPVVFATLFVFALIGLIANLISDITYTLIDPRIDFEKRD